MNAHPSQAAQDFLTSAAGVANGDPKGEIRLVGLALGFEKVVHGRLPYSGPIFLQKADRGLARVGCQHLLYTGGRGTDPHHTSPLCTHLAKHCYIRPRYTIGVQGVQGTLGSTAAIGWLQCGVEVQAGKEGSTAGNAPFQSQFRRGILYPSADWKCMSRDTVQARNPVPTKCTKCRGHKAQRPSAAWEPGQPQTISS